MISDILITLFLVLLNGFFVAAEFAIVKVRASQIEMRAQNGHGAAKLSSHIIHHLDGYLAATQLGITLASLGLGWVGEPVVSKIILGVFAGFGLQLSPELAHQIALPIAFAIITVLHIVFGELAPKSMAIQRPESTTLLIAYPLNAFYYIFKPFIWVLNGFANVILKLFGIHAVHGAEVHSSDELKYLLQQSNESGQIVNTDFDIIKNAFDFADRTTRQIMVPRNLVVAIDIQTFNENHVASLLDEGYSRIPCYEKNIDNIVGVLYTKDLLATLRKNQSVDIKSIMKPVIITTDTRKIGSLLKEFQHKHMHFAVVVDEFGGTEGIVTMEDIIEELVGEIQDEYDNEIPAVEKLDAKTYRVIPTVPLSDINHALPYVIEARNNAFTLAGILINEFNRIPNLQEKIILDEYEVTILKKNRNAISQVQLKVVQ